MRRAAMVVLVVGGVLLPSGPAIGTGRPGVGDRRLAGEATASPGDQLWVSHYDGPAPQPDFDDANAIVVSPDGSKVFVTGRSFAPTHSYDYATAAYDTTTGAVIWSARYNGPGNGADRAMAVAVSPDGSKVFVTGNSYGVGTDNDYATVAYSASTGAGIWVRRFNGPGDRVDRAFSVAVSPDGSKVFVTGESEGTRTALDYATLAYGAATGAPIWLRRYDGPGDRNDTANAVDVSPAGSTVFVTGGSYGPLGGTDYATAAYDASTGDPRWVTRYDGPDNKYDHADSITVSPDGSEVFVTGESGVALFDGDYATVAYDSASGLEDWAKRYDGTGHEVDVAFSIATNGSTVFVTGYSWGGLTNNDYATVAYGADSGATAWVSTYNSVGSSPDIGHSVATSPDGSKVFVTGYSYWDSSLPDYATVAYHAATGGQIWVARYDGTANGSDLADAVAASADGSKVFVTGQSTEVDTGGDYTTVGYEA